MPSFRIEPEPVRLVAVACVLLLAGCGTSTRLAEPEPIPTRPTVTVPSEAPSASAITARFLDAADDWMGAPYRFGGTTKRGVDCSAFVRAVYASAFGVALTRSTRTQVTEGRPVARDALRAGDLVFFRTGRDQRHVGIYLGDGRMLHASSAKNRVLVDDFHQDYFQRTYWTARRFLDTPPADAPAFAGASPRRAAPARTVSPEPAQPGPAGPASVRSGW